MRKTLFILLLTIATSGCGVFDNQLRPSSQITEGTSDIIPNGLVEWCNTLQTAQFYDEPECMWYCRVYSRNPVMHNLMVTKAKAEITTCELR